MTEVESKVAPPHVSIIIPCYNHAHYLPYAVHSVLAQTFTDWEAIIVDDGSTDDTVIVATQFADPRIRHVYQDNQGLSAARNTGIQMADGIHLAFLDADDEWEPAFLERCVSLLSSNESLAGVYTRNYFINESGDVLPKLGGRVVSRAEFRRRILEGGFFPPHAALTRAEVVREVGLFDTSLTSVEDWDLWIRISERYEMQGIPEPLARYRVYPGSMSTDAARMHANRIAVLTKYFGPPDGSPAQWSEEKRMTYGFAYRTAAYGYLQQRQPDRAWEHLYQAIDLWPALLARLDTFYELACGDQPRGYRGQADLLDIECNAADLFRRLDALFASADSSARALCGVAYGNAYLALAMLSDQAGKWPLARGYLLRAVRAHPGLLKDSSVVRRLLKLSLGRRIVSRLRRLQTTSAVKVEG